MLEQSWTTNLVIAVLHGLIGPFLYGFNASMLNVPADFIKASCDYTMANKEYDALSSFFCFGGMVGALSCGIIADKIGRKKVLLILDFAFIAGGVIFLFLAKKQYYWFALGRFLVGVGGGGATSVVPPYLGEISPPLIRGTVGTLTQLLICFGIVITTVFGYHKMLGSESLWKWLLFATCIPSIAQLCFFWTFPESPKWLLQQNRESDARKALQRLRQTDNVDLDILIMKTSIQNTNLSKVASKHNLNVRRSKHSLNKHSLTAAVSESVTSPDALIELSFEGKPTTSAKHSLNNSNRRNKSRNLEKQPLIDREREARQTVCFGIFAPQNVAVRKALVISVTLQIMQQLSGINSVFYYSDNTFTKAGIDKRFVKWLGTMSVNTANFLAVFVAVALMDRWGRRQLLIVSSIGAMTSLCLLSVALFFDSQKTWGFLCIGFMTLYVIFFEFGLGPIPWLIVAEIAPTSHRGIIMSFASFVNWTGNLIIAQFANPIVNSAKYFPFIAIMALGVVFTLKYVPETKGKNERQIQKELRG